MTLSLFLTQIVINNKIKKNINYCIILLFFSPISILSIQLNNNDYEVLNIAIDELFKYSKYSKLYICDSTLFNMELCPSNSNECVKKYKNNIYGNRYKIDDLIYNKLIDDFYLKNITRNYVNKNHLKFENTISLNVYDFYNLSISYEMCEKFKIYFKDCPSRDFMRARAIERYGKNNIFIFLSAPSFYNNYAFVKYFYFIPDEEIFHFYGLFFKKTNNKWVKIE